MHDSMRVLICLAVSISTAAVATAETSPQHPLFDHIDANHDGVISLAEWLSFRSEIQHQHDDQPPAGAATTMSGLNQRHAQRSPPAIPPSAAVGANAVSTRSSAASDERHPLFDRIDSDHNGVITLAEWSAFRSAYGRAHHRPGAGRAARATLPATPAATPPAAP